MASAAADGAALAASGDAQLSPAATAPRRRQPLLALARRSQRSCLARCRRLAMGNPRVPTVPQAAIAAAASRW
eukprot:2922951-Prymnesium_polylepis.1